MDGLDGRRLGLGVKDCLGERRWRAVTPGGGDLPAVCRIRGAAAQHSHLSGGRQRRSSREANPALWRARDPAACSAGFAEAVQMCRKKGR